jgi:glycosyltransferase involved in cell wall biosynthesis
LGVDVAVLPLPVRDEEVRIDSRAPTFVTFVNPEPIKGVAVFARIAEEISSRNLQIPFLVVKSRGTADDLIGAGLAGGFDLRRHSNIVIAEPVPDPKRIYAVTRVLLVPSLEEPAGRVAAEALLNGIPVIASDRGGLPEMLHGGGFVLPLPDDLSPINPIPPTAGAIRHWIDLTVRLMTKPDAYREACDRARRAAGPYDHQALISAYCNYFANLLGSLRY